MMCPKCGKIFDGDNRRCPECGAEFAVQTITRGASQPLSCGLPSSQTVTEGPLMLLSFLRRRFPDKKKNR